MATLTEPYEPVISFESNEGLPFWQFLGIIYVIHHPVKLSIQGNDQARVDGQRLAARSPIAVGVRAMVSNWLTLGMHSREN